MALQKTMNYKGYEANYWMITNLSWAADTNRTNGVLSLYKDEATRQDSLANSLSDQNRMFSFDGNLSVAECYAKLVEPNPLKIVDTPAMAAVEAVAAVDEVKDEEDNIVTPAVAAVEAVAAVDEVSHNVEQNFFADAVTIN